MNRILAASAVSAVALLALTGCIPAIVGGPMTSEEREIDAVTTVTLDTSGDVTIAEGEPRLVIHASEGALARLTSDVDGDTLTLGNKPGPAIGLGEVRYELYLPSLDRLIVSGSGDIDSTVSTEGTFLIEISGSGDVDVDDLATNRVEVSVSGSGDVGLEGTTVELAIELDGSGEIDAEGLEAQEAVVEVSGSGNVDVSVRDNLAAGVSGSGTVTYRGDPVVASEVSGSGSITRDR